MLSAHFTGEFPVLLRQHGKHFFIVEIVKVYCIKTPTGYSKKMNDFNFIVLFIIEMLHKKTFKS